MLHEEPERDHFKSESPIRAFTDWNVVGCYAIGKGFRPSLAHVPTYLNAMSVKEGWELVQILESTTQTPSFVFRKSPASALELFARQALGEPYESWTNRRSEEQRAQDDADEIKTGSKRLSGLDAMQKIDQARTISARLDDVSPEHLAGFMGVSTAEIEAEDNFSLMQPRERTLADDPVNPAHYAGTACAEIGERLSGNSYQVLKYNWRLGKKDEACQEIDKSLWYLAREIELAKDVGQPLGTGFGLPDDAWFGERLQGQDSYVRMVARKLIDWNRHGDISCLIAVRGIITTHKTTFTCPEFGRQLEG